jgi:hypothetical protein
MYKSVMFGLFNTMKGLRDHLACVGHIEVFDAKSGSQVFCLQIGREFMLKTVDLISDLLLLCWSARFPKLPFETKNSSRGIPELFPGGQSFVSCNLIMQVLKMMDDIIEEVKRSMT